MAPRPALSLMLVVALTACGDSPTDINDSGITLLEPAEGAVLANACMLDAAPSIVWEFDWSDVPGATRYHLFVKADTAPHPAIDVSGLTHSDYRSERSVYIINTNLDGWTWRVRAQVGTEWGPWTEERGFSVEPLNTSCL